MAFGIFLAVGFLLIVALVTSTMLAVGRRLACRGGFLVLPSQRFGRGILCRRQQIFPTLQGLRLARLRLDHDGFAV